MADPTTVSELIDWFEHNFLCCVGPARAYFEIPIGPGGAFTRVVYESYVVMRGDRSDTEQRLVAAMYADFSQLIGTTAHETMLFWRYPEKIKLETQLRQLFGRTLVTREVVEDGLAEIPPGAILDHTNDCYCEDAGRVCEWTLRTRLHIPSMDWMPTTPAFVTKKAEGAVALSV